MIRKALSLIMAAAAIATLFSVQPAKAQNPVGGALAVGYTKLSNGSSAYVNVGISDYGTRLAGQIIMVAGTQTMRACATAIHYDPANKFHATLNFTGLLNNTTIVSGTIDAYVDNPSAKTGRFAMSMWNATTKFAISGTAVSPLQGNVWVVSP